MKVVLLLVLVTLLGAAMLAVGIAGVAGAFEKDEDSSSERFAIDERKDCSKLDPRLELFNSWQTSVGDSGSVRIVVSCTDGEIEASVFGSGLATDNGRVLALWAWRTRRDAQLVQSYPQAAGDDGVVFFEGTLPSDLPRYRKLVVTTEDAGDAPDDPGQILTQSVIE